MPMHVLFEVMPQLAQLPGVPSHECRVIGSWEGEPVLCVMLVLWTICDVCEVAKGADREWLLGCKRRFSMEIRQVQWGDLFDRSWIEEPKDPQSRLISNHGYFRLLMLGR